MFRMIDSKKSFEGKKIYKKMMDGKIYGLFIKISNKVLINDRKNGLREINKGMKYEMIPRVLGDTGLYESFENQLYRISD